MPPSVYCVVLMLIVVKKKGFIMKCTHCGKEFELITQFYDNTPGAVIIALDSEGTLAVWPAAEGLEKREGCVEFSRADGGQDNLENESDDGEVKLLGQSQCRDLYGDVPPDDTAWLVVPTKIGYDWYEITDEIVFSD